MSFSEKPRLDHGQWQILEVKEASTTSNLGTLESRQSIIVKGYVACDPSIDNKLCCIYRLGEFP